MKGRKLYAQVNLEKGERSELSELAEIYSENTEIQISETGRAFTVWLSGIGCWTRQSRVLGTLPAFYLSKTEKTQISSLA